MVGMAAAAQFLSAPGQSYSVAAFKEPMRDGLGISETDFSLAYAFATIVSGALLPMVGRWVDRLGARRTLPLIAVFLGGGCIAMSRVTSLGGLYAGFSLVRALGQGALSLVAAWLVGEWFSRRRGFATALSGVGGSLSVMSIPLINNAVIVRYGWEAGWLVLGVIVWVVLVLPSVIFVRDRPEQLGLLPDGDTPTDHAPGQSSVATPEAVAPEKVVSREPSPVIVGDHQWTVAGVLRDATFWKLLAVPATSGMVGTGLVFHTVSLLGSRGISPTWALTLITLQALIATCGALGAGWLTDRVAAGRLLAAAMLCLAAASFLVLVMPTPWLAILYAVLLGLHGSIIRSTGMVVWINYYGRMHQGAIRGIAMAAMIFSAAIGPLPLALSVDWFDTYNYALALFLATPLASAALVSTAGPPRAQPSSV